MFDVKRILVWISRIGRCRGFGVQSPWAYSFIRYVVNEHYPYYAYSDLRSELPDVERLTRKKAELMFRIANYCRSPQVLAFGGSGVYGKYIMAGSTSSEVVEVKAEADSGYYNNVVERLGAPGMVLIRSRTGCREFYRAVMEHADGQTLLVVEGIHARGEAKALWKKIWREDHVVMFDLYYCGVVFFDKKRYKQKYIVNF